MREVKWIIAGLTIALRLIASLWTADEAAAKVETSGPRLALVIGNAQYRDTPLATAANDAGLIAETLRMAGFDVTGAADLDRPSALRVFKEFLTKVQQAGPRTAVFVYLTGYGLQYAGENYFVPVDAGLQHDTDIAKEAIRVSDLTQSLGGMPLQTRIVVLDIAKTNPFPVSGDDLAIGLALPAPEPGTLFAFNAAPGMAGVIEKGNYGAYATGLAEMLRYGGIPIDLAFARLRLRVNDVTHGALVPWNISKLTPPPILLANANSDGPPSIPLETFASLRAEPIRDFSDADEAYTATLELDTLSDYQEFLAAFPEAPLYPRVEALLAHRREALTWDQAFRVNQPAAYWCYMRRYPNGPHLADARRRLTDLSAPLDSPQPFPAYDFMGLPAPSEEELAILSHPAFVSGGLDYAPVPPVAARFLPPLPAELRHLAAPDEVASGFLPVPAVIPSSYARPPERMGTMNHPELDSPEAAPAALGDEGKQDLAEPGDGQDARMNEDVARPSSLNQAPLGLPRNLLALPHRRRYQPVARARFRFPAASGFQAGAGQLDGRPMAVERPGMR